MLQINQLSYLFFLSYWWLVLWTMDYCAKLCAISVWYCINCKYFHDSLLRLPPRYRPIWTIYIPFESPWLIDFRNARFDFNFWRYVMPCGATRCQLVFSGCIAAWELRHTRKTIRLKILPNLLFYQFMSKLFASRSTLCHLSMTQRHWENVDYIKFRSTFAVSIEVSKLSDAKSFSLGWCVVLLLVTTLSKFQFFCDKNCPFYNINWWGMSGTIITKLWTWCEKHLSAGTA